MLVPLVISCNNVPDKLNSDRLSIALQTAKDIKDGNVKIIFNDTNAKKYVQALCSDNIEVSNVAQQIISTNMAKARKHLIDHLINQNSINGAIQQIIENKHRTNWDSQILAHFLATCELDEINNFIDKILSTEDTIDIDWHFLKIIGDLREYIVENNSDSPKNIESFISQFTTDYANSNKIYNYRVKENYRNYLKIAGYCGVSLGLQHKDSNLSNYYLNKAIKLHCEIEHSYPLDINRINNFPQTRFLIALFLAKSEKLNIFKFENIYEREKIVESNLYLDSFLFPSLPIDNIEKILSARYIKYHIDQINSGHYNKIDIREIGIISNCLLAFVNYNYSEAYALANKLIDVVSIDKNGSTFWGRYYGELIWNLASVDIDLSFMLFSKSKSKKEFKKAYNSCQQSFRRLRFVPVYEILAKSADKSLIISCTQILRDENIPVNSKKRIIELLRRINSQESFNAIVPLLFNPRHKDIHNTILHSLSSMKKHKMSQSIINEIYEIINYKKSEIAILDNCLVLLGYINDEQSLEKLKNIIIDFQYEKLIETTLKSIGMHRSNDSHKILLNYLADDNFSEIVSIILGRNRKIDLLINEYNQTNENSFFILQALNIYGSERRKKNKIGVVITHSIHGEEFHKEMCNELINKGYELELIDSIKKNENGTNYDFILDHECKVTRYKFGRGFSTQYYVNGAAVSTYTPPEEERKYVLKSNQNNIVLELQASYCSDNSNARGEAIYNKLAYDFKCLRHKIPINYQ